MPVSAEGAAGGGPFCPRAPAPTPRSPARLGHGAAACPRAAPRDARGLAMATGAGAAEGRPAGCPQPGRARARRPPEAVSG